MLVNVMLKTRRNDITLGNRDRHFSQFSDRLKTQQLIEERNQQIN